jgi:hypothetical protein
MKIICGDRVMEVPCKRIMLSISGSIGCIGVDGNDLFDLGLRPEEIIKADHKVEIHIGDVVLIIDRREKVDGFYVPFVEIPGT